MAFPPVSSVVKSHFQVLMEHFDDPDLLQDAINCSEKCADLATTPLLSLHQRTPIGAGRPEEAVDHIMGVLEETKRAVSVVKEMRQRVKYRSEHNMGRTREVFNALRKTIDDQEERVIGEIKKGADKREKALEVLL